MKPLTKRVSDGLKWTMSVQDMPRESNFPYPVFRWILNEEGGIALRALPFHGIFVFEVRGEEIRFISIKNILKKIDSYGWSKPPHIKEVFKDVIETKEKSPVRNLEEFEQVAEKLRQKWNKLIE